MKVLLITVRSDFGGGPKHVDQLVSYLPADVELYMAYPSEGDPYSAIWRNSERIKKTVSIPFRSFSISKFFQLRELIIREKIEIVHSHGNGAGLYSRLLKLSGCRIAVVHSFHGIIDSYGSNIKSIVNKGLGRFLRRYTDRFLMVSKGELIIGKNLHFINSSNSEVIYNGVLAPDSYEYHLSDVINIISLTRFDYAKNMDYAFEIAKHFKNDSRVLFTWVGDGEDKDRLEALSKKEKCNIVFTGYIRDPFKYLHAASLYLSTSRFEGLPYGIIEASSLGIPTIATNVRGNNEVVRDKFTGYLFNTKIEAISIINDILNDKNKLIELSKNSREFFMDTFTMDRMVNSIYNIYLGVVSK